MGSVLSAIRDDEEEWYDLVNRAGISDQKWKLYSEEAGFAEEGFVKHKMAGALLVKFVHAKKEVKRLIRLAEEVVQAEKQIKELEKKRNRIKETGDD